MSVKTAGLTHAWILMMMLSPDAMKKAQAELDKVVGPDRLPHYSDREKLPYLDACMNEALRLHTLAPNGMLYVPDLQTSTHLSLVSWHAGRT